jgi:transcriptional regulator with XRE-family HTH domain
MGLIEKLKEARRRTGMRQEDVERETEGKIKAKTISNWENGVSRPDVDSIAVLCKLYKIEPNELFEWPEPRSKGEDWSRNEKQEIDKFKEYLRSKRS